MNFYNDCNPLCSRWLARLVKYKHIPDGVVDGGKIEDVEPGSLQGYKQAHFFAGIGGWSHALRLAGWPQNLPVWTGSCPCQPFSHAGKKEALSDSRHLWPIWFRLIKECHPPVVFGEQVEAAIAYGWLDLVFDDLEGEGYACASAVLPAACVGAPHARHRLFFVADSDGVRAEGLGKAGEPDGEASLRGRPGDKGFWRDAKWLPCRDGKIRAYPPVIPPMAYGVPAIVGRLRACGNAIVPQVAAEFIQAYMRLKPNIARLCDRSSAL